MRLERNILVLTIYGAIKMVKSGARPMESPWNPHVFGERHGGSDIRIGKILIPFYGALFWPYNRTRRLPSKRPVFLEFLDRRDASALGDPGPRRSWAKLAPMGRTTAPKLLHIPAAKRHCREHVPRKRPEYVRLRGQRFVSACLADSRRKQGSFPAPHTAADPRILAPARNGGRRARNRIAAPHGARGRGIVPTLRPVNGIFRGFSGPEPAVALGRREAGVPGFGVAAGAGAKRVRAFPCFAGRLVGHTPLTARAMGDSVRPIVQLS